MGWFSVNIYTKTGKCNTKLRKLTRMWMKVWPRLSRNKYLLTPPLAVLDSQFRFGERLYTIIHLFTMYTLVYYVYTCSIIHLYTAAQLCTYCTGVYCCLCLHLVNKWTLLPMFTLSEQMDTGSDEVRPFILLTPLYIYIYILLLPLYIYIYIYIIDTYALLKWTCFYIYVYRYICMYMYMLYFFLSPEPKINVKKILHKLNVWALDKSKNL